MILLKIAALNGNGTSFAHRRYIVPFLVISLLLISAPLFLQEASGVNEPPVADAGEDIFDVLLNEVHILDGGNSTDEDLGNCTWLWECISHDGINITDGDSPVATFTVFTEEQITFQLTITDPEDEFDTDEIVVTPRINEDPSVDPGTILPMDTGTEGPFYEIGTPIEFNATSVSDLETPRSGLIFTWSSDVPGEGAFPSLPAFTREMNILGWHNITLTVEDPNGGLSQVVKMIKVREDRSAPVAKMAVFPIKEIYNKGEVLTLDASRTEDINSFDTLETMNFTWESNVTEVGLIGYGPVLTFVPTEGYHNITLQVLDTDGLASDDYQTIQVVNQAPTAEITTPGMKLRDGFRTVNVTEEAFLSGYRSSDPNNDELIFLWDFGDQQTATGMNVTHAWTSHGTYNVTLEISDGSMKDSTASSGIQISVNTIPEAVIEPVNQIEVNTPYTFSANGTVDIDGDPLVYKWDLDGDGTFDQSGFNTTYTFREEGDFEITLRVEDGFAWSEATTMVKSVFPNEAPVPKLVNFDYVEGENIIVLLDDNEGEITLDASASYDPDDDIDGNGVIDGRERNNLTYYWDENADRDSSADSDNIKDNDFTRRSKTLTVILENDNVFKVRLNVTDPRGESSYLTISLKGNHAPVISNARTDKGTELYVNASVLLQTTAQDPDSRTAPLEYRWTIGETELESTSNTYTYRFREPGEFEILAEVSDGTFTSSFPFVVNVREFNGLSIKNPRQNQVISGIVLMNGMVDHDPDFDIDEVQVKVDQGQWMDASNPPSWEFELVTSQYSDGPHTIYVRVLFESGVEQTSSVEVEFDNQVESDNTGMIIAVVLILVAAVIIGVIGYFLFGRKSNRARDLMMDLPPPPGYGPGSPGMVPPGGLPSPPGQSNLPAAQKPPSEDKKEVSQPPKEEGPKMIRVKCPACRKVFKVTDNGERPLEMTCTHCGARGTISTVPGDEENKEDEPGEDEEEQAPEPISIICPNCSGMFELEEFTEVAKCPFCQVSGDLDEETIAKLHERFDEPKPEEMTVKCPSCQGKFSIKSTDTDIICPFCGASGNVSGKN